MRKFDEILMEKSYRLTGPYSTKTKLGGKLASAFKSKISKLKYDGTNKDEVIKELTSEWKKFRPEFIKITNDIVISEAKKAWGKNYYDEAIVYIDAKHKKTEWIMSDEKTFEIKNDLIINIGTGDDVNANKLAKRLKAWVNDAIPQGDIIYGSWDNDVQNIESSDNFLYLIDDK